MNKWTKQEVEYLIVYAEASDDETMTEMYEYVHHMMYKEGNHPDFPVRSLSAITSKLRSVCRESGEK